MSPWLLTESIVCADWAKLGWSEARAKAAWRQATEEDKALSLVQFAEKFQHVTTPEFRGVSEEDILSRIECGESIAQIAADLGCVRSVLWKWLESDEKRSAGATRARQLAAMAWDDMAEKGISDALDPFELAKAKEIAHHYRWRSSKIAPKVYGDKTVIEGGETPQKHEFTWKE